MSSRSWSVAIAALVLTACSDPSGEGAATTVAARVTQPVAPDTAPATSASAAATTAITTAATATATTATVTQPPSTVTAPTAPTATPSPVPSSPVVTPQGFATVAGRVTAADGSTCDVCLWLAASAAERTQGLMGVTDLGGADGMVFRWDDATSGSFWMRDTPQPLSIAFYGADGAFVSAADMVPCLQPTPDSECARYAASGSYQYAVEVAAGGLPALLMEQGSRLELLEADCPLAT